MSVKQPFSFILLRLIMRKHLELYVFVSVILWFTGLEDTTFFWADVAMIIFYIFRVYLVGMRAGDNYVGTCYVGPRTQYCPSHLPSSAHHAQWPMVAPFVLMLHVV